MATPRRLFACALVMLFAALAGCDGCADRGPVIATLVKAVGPSVQRDFADQLRVWQPADIGATFSLGDAVRTDASSTAELTLIDNTQLGLRPRTTIRFLVDGAQAGEQSLAIESGEVALNVGNRDLSLRTHIGLATLIAGSRVMLTRDGDHVEYAVQLGEARFRDPGGELHMVKEGESLEVGIGMAVLRKPSEPESPPDAGVEQAPEPPPPGAIAADVQTEGVRMRTDSGSWTRLARGHHDLAQGTELRLSKAAKVQLSQGTEQALLRGAGEFVVGTGSAMVEARQGDLRVTSEQADVQVMVPGGTIIVRAGGSAARLSVGEDLGEIDVERGSVSTDLMGQQRDLNAGDEQRWAHSSEAIAAQKPIEPGAAYYNLMARAGESFTVHAPEVPVTVGFDLTGKCPHDVVIEVVGTKLRVRGKDRVNVTLPTGSHPYTARCIDEVGTLGKVLARASVQVQRDAGTRKLPSRAPTSFVEADGRTYTVYYQNQPPEVSVRWPNAPPSPKYQLALDEQAPVALAKPEQLFKSGSLRDGTHRISFQAGDRKSRTTVVEVRFDNAAPKASLSAPIDRGFKPGDKVTIEGVALETWKVSVTGGDISMDADERFLGEVATTMQQPDIAVRLAHPRLGVHYYLRRAAGSP